MRVGNGPDSRTLHEKLRMLTSLWTECPRRDLTPHTPVILRSYSRIHRAQLISPVDPLSLHICGLGALKQTPFSTTAESAHVSRVTCSLCLEMQRHCRSFYPSVIKAAGSNGKYLRGFECSKLGSAWKPQLSMSWTGRWRNAGGPKLKHGNAPTILGRFRMAGCFATVAGHARQEHSCQRHLVPW